MHRRNSSSESAASSVAVPWAPFFSSGSSTGESSGRGFPPSSVTCNSGSVECADVRESLRDHGVAPSMVTSSAAAAEDSTIRPALRTRSLPSTRLVTLWEGRRRARETPTAFR